jgi:hypothetical protein
MEIIIYKSLPRLRITIERTENIGDKLYCVFGRISPLVILAPVELINAEQYTICMQGC